MRDINGYARVDSEQKPVRKMNDIGPRRSMDMVRRPAAAPPTAPPPPPPQPRVTPAPVARPAAAVRSQASVQPQSRAQAAPQPTPSPAAPKPRRRLWWVILQFVIGLLVIAGVAVAIVALYVRYYQ